VYTPSARLFSGLRNGLRVVAVKPWHCDVGACVGEKQPRNARLLSTSLSHAWRMGHAYRDRVKKRYPI
jgi:hypothetical protein